MYIYIYTHTYLDSLWIRSANRILARSSTTVSRPNSAKVYIYDIYIYIHISIYIYIYIPGLALYEVRK